MKHIILPLLLALMPISAMSNDTTARIVTYYNLRGITASGERVRPGICALSPDLLKKFPMHSTIHVEGVGTLIVKDKTSSRLRGVVDVWRANGKGWKNRHNVKITRIK